MAVPYGILDHQRARLERHVLDWAKRYCDEAERINVYSAAQKQQLLFAPFKNEKKKLELPAERAFDVGCSCVLAYCLT